MGCNHKKMGASGRGCLIPQSSLGGSPIRESVELGTRLWGVAGMIIRYCNLCFTKIPVQNGPANHWAATHEASLQTSATPCILLPTLLTRIFGAKKARVRSQNHCPRGFRTDSKVYYFPDFHGDRDSTVWPLFPRKISSQTKRGPRSSPSESLATFRMQKSHLKQCKAHPSATDFINCS